MAGKGNPKEQKHPAPIVKKKLHLEEGGHHGGVWKIAYADFMTAMMTFFLVMWLVNSSSKAKITQLASYFNPVKLNDRSPHVKGIVDPKQTEAGDEKGPAEKVDKEKEKASKASKASNDAGKPGEKPDTPQRHAEEDNILGNPFGALGQLASQAEGAMAAATAQGGQDRLPAGGSSHDPFVTDPLTSQLVNRTAGPGERQGPGLELGASNPPPAKPEANPPKEERPADAKTEPSALEKQPKEKQAKLESLEKAAQLEKELTHLIGSLPQSFRPNVLTKATDEGILVSLTDDANFNMFKLSSSEPSPQLVLFLEKAGGIINKYPGKIVIRGHTDGRPYAGDRYGNWRLSVNRATMTYYMLLRGKVDESRFLALEGYADRKLKNRADPFAGENRRIEILIRGPEAS